MAGKTQFGDLLNGRGGRESAPLSSRLRGKADGAMEAEEMKVFRMKTKNGERVRLVSDDTLTLAISCGGALTETTRSDLAAIFPARARKRLAARLDEDSARKLGFPL